MVGRWACAAAFLGILLSCGSDSEPSATTGGGSTSSASSASSASSSGSTSGSGGGDAWPWLPFQHEPCPDAGCPAPLTCLTYCDSCDGGIQSSCEVACDPAKPNCPSGEACVNIADGPGNVCAHF